MEPRKGQSEAGDGAARRRVDGLVRRPLGGRRVPVRSRHAVAGRARGQLPLRRDAGPTHDHRRGQRGPVGAAANGPAGVWGRRVRQDRGGAQGGFQGRPVGPPGRHPRADHRPCPATLRHVHRAAGAVSGQGRDAIALPQSFEPEIGRRRPRLGSSRYLHRDPPHLAAGCFGQEPRPRGDRRGTQVRSDPQGDD